MVSDIKLLDFSKKYSYADYLTWTFPERLELINGKIFDISVSPGTLHQRISMIILGEMFDFFKQRKIQIFHALFDVRFPQKLKNDEDVFTVVQPDICVICDDSKIDTRGCIGAPDLIVEILSPGNTTREMKDKFDLYEESGVFKLNVKKYLV